MARIRDAIMNDRYGDFVEEFRTRREYTDNVR